MVTTLVGERLESAKQAYNEYAKTANNDPLAMAFFEGVQWADQNPKPQWSKVEDSDECMALMASFIHHYGYIAVMTDCLVGDVVDSVRCAMDYDYWMPLPKLPN